MKKKQHKGEKDNFPKYNSYYHYYYNSLGR